MNAEPATVVATQIDGTRLAGVLRSWDTTSITLQTDTEAVTLDASQLLRVQWSSERSEAADDQPMVTLTDGTTFPSRSYLSAEGTATVSTLLAEQPLKIPTEDIAYVQIMPNSPAWDTALNELEGDTLVVHKKKSDTFDRLSGLLGDVTDEQVDFTWDGETIPVKRSKVAALAYYHATATESPAPVFWLQLHNRARIPVAALQMTEDQLVVKTVSGYELRADWMAVSVADYSQGKLAYLSDLRPIWQRWTPRIGLPEAAELIQQHGRPRRDQAFNGSSLSLAWPNGKSQSLAGDIRTYDKGLAIRSRTILRYRLPKGMRRLVAIAGIDPETLGEGNVTLEILADKRSVWQGEIDGRAPPTELNVELGQARRLSIVVDYGANLDFGDRLHLVEARVTR